MVRRYGKQREEICGKHYDGLHRGVKAVFIGFEFYKRLFYFWVFFYLGKL